MKISKNYIIIAAVLLVAFVTNPGKEKHVENASEIFSEHLALEEESALMNYAIGSTVEALITHRVRLNNYLLFSTSSIYSPQKNESLLYGIGFLGQVFPLASEDDIENASSEVDMDLLNNGEESKTLIQNKPKKDIDKALRSLFNEQ